ncbi:MAG: mechanosensitive ion channel domain-containing protein [Nanoarchaeota archaeon]
MKNRLLTYVYGIIIVAIPVAFVIAVLTLCNSYSCISFGKESISFFSKFSEYLPKAFLILVWFIGVRIFIYLFVRIFLRRYVFEYKTDSQYIVASKLSKLIAYTIFVVISLSIIFKNVGAIITSLGLIGFGITFAMQKPLLNLVGWISLIVNKPFLIGDRISIGQVKGDVIDINLMNTVLEGLLENSDTRSGKLVTFPNEWILTMDITNYTRSSNYLINELRIGITYESDYRKAISLLEKIIKDNTKKIVALMKKRITRKESEIDETIKHLTKRFLAIKQKEEEQKIQKKIEELKQEKLGLSASAEELPEEFVPKIRIDLAQSSIDLIAFFVAPYDRIKKTKTEIFLAFLDAIKSEDDIEVAYPHMQIMSKKDEGGPFEGKKQ